MKKFKKDDLVVCISDNWELPWYSKVKNFKTPKRGHVYTIEYTCTVDGILFLGLKELLQPTHLRKEFPFIKKEFANEVWAACNFEKIIYDEAAIEEVISEEINQIG